ncbi:hypothetical protein FBY22_7009 [Streptomyces sp. SLBN-31]|jgi:hypothetical protein|nr:hypothetical protein FBY22_7009 [Streptomyces sp. SLBN-31]
MSDISGPLDSRSSKLARANHVLIRLVGIIRLAGLPSGQDRRASFHHPGGGCAGPGRAGRWEGPVTGQGMGADLP